MPKQNGDPTLREIKQRHANELCEKANEIFRLEQTIAAMTETAEEANRSYISQHNQIQELQAATLAAEARIRDVLHKLSIASDDYVVCGGPAKYAEGMDYVIKQVTAALTEHKENHE